MLKSKSRRQRSKILCDGSEVDWEPKWQANECEECGHPTGETDIAEPDYHGKKVWREGRLFCDRCDGEFGGLERINQICFDAMIPQLYENIKKSNSFWNFYKHGR